MKTRIIFTVILAAFVFAAGALFMIGGDENITGNAIVTSKTIKIGYLAIASDLSFFVALDNGYFEKRGLIVEPIKFESSNQAIDALVSGRIDGTSIVALEAFLSVEDRYPGRFKVFEMTAAEKDTEVHRVIVRKDSDTQALEDLEGKTIGTYPGSQMKVFTELILKNHIDIDAVNIVQMAPSLQAQALASGQVDALFTLEPIGTIAESKDIARAIAINPLYKEVLKPFPTAASAFSSGFIIDHPDIAERYAEAINEAHSFIETSPDKAKESLSAYTEIDPGIAVKVGIYSYWDLEKINRRAVNKLVDIYVKNDILKKKVAIEDILLN